jgi:AcrR family transcriptional regulator
MTSGPDKMRRPGYAPAANVEVGRRGRHTRDRILACAADVFLANGFHGSSLDTIAKAANASRATVYQYFAGKEDIFRELSAAAEREMLKHSEGLGELGPTVAGVDALHRWLVDWADIYDTHAVVFAEFPGIGTATGLAVIDAGAMAETFRLTVTERLRHAPLSGLDVHDAAAVLGRIPHMVQLYRHRAMFPLPAPDVVSWSLTIALQLMLFPDTPDDALRAAAPSGIDNSPSRPPVVRPTESTAGPDGAPLSPIAQDVLTASSPLFAERGYYAVGMEEIAAAADLSRATLYRYFSTKTEILAELTRRAVTEIEERAAALQGLAAGAFPSSCPTRRSSTASARSTAPSKPYWTPLTCLRASTARWLARCSWRCWAG